MDEEALLLAGAGAGGRQPGDEGDDESMSSDDGSESSSDIDTEDEESDFRLNDLRDGVRVEIRERNVPRDERGGDGDEADADAAAGGDVVVQRGARRVELQIQIQLQSAGRREAGPVAYDTGLPTQHSYLGDNFSRVAGGRVYEPGQKCQLPVYYCRAHLVPGRTLPFMCDTPQQESMVRHLTSGSDAMFAVLCMQPSREGWRRRNFEEDMQPPTSGDIGCTAQLMSCGETDDGEYRVICKGIQRFRLNEISVGTTSVRLVDVTILPDLSPPAFPHYLLPARPQTYRRSPFCRQSPYSRPASSATASGSITRGTGVDSDRSTRPRRNAGPLSSVVNDIRSLLRSGASAVRVREGRTNHHPPAAAPETSTNEKGSMEVQSSTDAATAGEVTPGQQTNVIRQKHMSLLGPVSLKAFQRCNYEITVEQVFQELLPWRKPIRLSRHEVIPFSYYVLASMPLDRETRRGLLSINCALRRLLRVLELMRSCRFYCCQNCGRAVAERTSIFSMSDDGPSALYVNPSNIITEMFTARDTISFATAQLLPASREFSWFPGYAWCCSICISCSSHIGWSFETDDRALSPRQFFGLTQSNVIPDFAVAAREARLAGDAPHHVEEDL